MHPLTPDLSGLSDDELFKKRSELQNKLSFAYNIGNGELVNQISLVLGDYAIEAETRNRRLLDQAMKSGRFGADPEAPFDITRD